MIYLKVTGKSPGMYERITEEEYTLLILSGKYVRRPGACKNPTCKVCDGKGNNRTLVPAEWKNPS